MTRKEQDNLWDVLPDEKKRAYQQEYLQFSCESSDSDFIRGKNEGRICILIDTFGEHNLKPSLTYGDVARELFIHGYCYYDYVYDEIVDNTAACEMPMACTSRKQAEKICALNKLLNVAKFLNRNEDGSDWVPDWFDLDQNKFSVFFVKGELKILGRCSSLNSPVYFRTEEIAEQAIQILGEDIIRTALTSEY